MSHPYIGQKKIKEIIYKILEPTLEQQGWYLSKLMVNWESVIGTKWKDHIWPSRYAPNFQDRSTGTLYLKVSHLGMQQVQFTKGYLIEVFNMYLGCPAIQDIKAQLWHTTNLPLTQLEKKEPSQVIPQPKVENIQDTDLKQALEDLGSILSSRQ